jgi:hypothetical protein
MTDKKIESIVILDKSEDLLEWVFEIETDSSSDPRGFYAEFESEGCKPWKPIHVAELIEAGLVTDHAESDSIPSVSDIQQAEKYESSEMWGGVAFLSITELGKTYIKENGLAEE